MKNFKKIKDKDSNITSDDIESCNDEKDLLKMKTTIEANMIQVKQQIDSANGKAAANGEYADPEWYSKATSYKRVLGFLHQRILLKQREMKQEREDKSKTIENFFMTSAKDILPPDQFFKILSAAHEAKNLVSPEEMINS